MPPSIEENAEGSAAMKPPPGVSRRLCRRARRWLGTALFYRTSRIVLGIVLLVIGVAGLILPILPGVLTIVGGLAILRKDTPFVARFWDRCVAPLWQRYRRWRGRAAVSTGPGSGRAS